MTWFSTLEELVSLAFGSLALEDGLGPLCLEIDRTCFTAPDFLGAVSTLEAPKLLLAGLFKYSNMSSVT